MDKSDKIGPPTDLIGFKIRRAHNKIIQQWVTLGQEEGLEATPVESGIIIVIHKHPGVAHSALAQALGVDVSTLSQALAPLVKRGLVRREPDPEDGRSRLMFLTEDGTAMRAVIDRVLSRRRRRVANTFSDEELTQFHLLLDQFLASPDQD